MLAETELANISRPAFGTGGQGKVASSPEIGMVAEARVRWEIDTDKLNLATLALLQAWSFAMMSISEGDILTCGVLVVAFDAEPPLLG
ncbi:MAG TPA: hypothetical protein VF179_12940, partial [Thermoanaerobaculia bacterium]|nr:hypothetical protein [Thermoanaerobaculia bacterium]